MNPWYVRQGFATAHEVKYGSVRSCDECGDYVPFDAPDADYRVCRKCENYFFQLDGSLE